MSGTTNQESFKNDVIIGLTPKSSTGIIWLTPMTSFLLHTYRNVFHVVLSSFGLTLYPHMSSTVIIWQKPPPPPQNDDVNCEQPLKCRIFYFKEHSIKADQHMGSLSNSAQSLGCAHCDVMRARIQAYFLVGLQGKQEAKWM